MLDPLLLLLLSLLLLLLYLDLYIYIAFSTFVSSFPARPLWACWQVGFLPVPATPDFRLEAACSNKSDSLLLKWFGKPLLST